MPRSLITTFLGFAVATILYPVPTLAQSTAQEMQFIALSNYLIRDSGFEPPDSRSGQFRGVINSGRIAFGRLYCTQLHGGISYAEIVGQIRANPERSMESKVIAHAELLAAIATFCPQFEGQIPN